MLPGLADVFEGPGTGLVVQGYISEDWAKDRAGPSSTAYVAATVPSQFLDQLFYLSAMYLVSRQILLGEKTLVCIFQIRTKPPSGEPFTTRRVLDFGLLGVSAR